MYKCKTTSVIKIVFITDIIYEERNRPLAFNFHLLQLQTAIVLTLKLVWRTFKKVISYVKREKLLIKCKNGREKDSG